MTVYYKALGYASNIVYQLYDNIKKARGAQIIIRCVVYRDIQFGLVAICNDYPPERTYPLICRQKDSTLPFFNMMVLQPSTVESGMFLQTNIIKIMRCFMECVMQ